MAIALKAEGFVRVIRPVVGGSGRIRITFGKSIEEYDMATFVAWEGQATGVQLTKGDGTRYEVCISSEEEQCSCSCPGFTYHREQNPCKHLRALMALAARGLLPVPME